MNNQILHTPEGVRDIYGRELDVKLNVSSKLNDLLRKHGYEDIQTPTFEFFDIFSSNIGTTPSRELYKFFDKEGNTLVLRPDFTPSVVRAFTKYFYEESNPIRLCYLGNAFINNSDLQGRLKEMTQIGAEMFNDDSASADAEMISLMIKCMIEAGFKDFVISIGNVEFFKGLCEQYAIDTDTETLLREMISNKNYFRAKSFLDELKLDESAKEQLLSFSDLLTNINAIKDAVANTTNSRSKNALIRLCEIYDILKEDELADYISFDLGMLSKYHYYTGVIFRAYTFGSGDAVMKGGRYDSLVKEFGKAAPALGFVALIDDIVLALIKQGVITDVCTKGKLLLCNRQNRSKARIMADRFRLSDIPAVILETEDDASKYIEYAKRHNLEIVEV